MAKVWIPCEKDMSIIREYFEISPKSKSGLIWKTGNRFGNPALSTVQSDGRYYRGTIKTLTGGGQRQLLAHRVVFFLHNGYWPTGVVDHIDGDTFNNDPPNLREVTISENLLNQNSKGYRYRKDTILPWELQVQFEGVRYSPRFATEEEAIVAVKEWKSKIAPSLNEKFRWS